MITYTRICLEIQIYTSNRAIELGGFFHSYVGFNAMSDYCPKKWSEVDHRRDRGL